MKGKKWLVLPVSLAIVLLANSVGGTMASFVDLESSGSNTFEAWTSRQWLQTTEGDFNAGVLNNVDTSLSPGDVTLAQVGWGNYSSELLINPGAEIGDTAGWTAVGTHTANFVAGTECQNCPSGGAPAGPRTGTYSFMWNTPTASDDWAYQEIDLFASGFEEKISAGEAQLIAGGYLVCGECNPDWDRIQLRILLYDSGHSLIETSHDSGQLFQICSWTWYGIADYDIPTNARYVRIEFQTIEPPSWGAGKADDFTVKVRVKEQPFWYDPNWTYRRQITIDHTKVEDVADPSTTYANFPVLVYATGLSNIKANGADIRFTLSDGVTEIPREIESYSGGTLYAWVKVTLTKDASDSTDDVIYMYYGNAAATEPAPASAYGSQNVWDNNFVMVQHLQETSGSHYDSTQYGNDGTANVTVQGSATGKIDGADEFNGTTDYVEVATSNWNAGNGTVEVWGYAAVLSDHRYFFGHTTVPAYANRIQLYTYGAAGDLALGLGDAHSRNTSIQALNINTWYYITLTWDGSDYVVYVDGAPAANGPYSGLSTIYSFADIGNDGYTGERTEAFDGILDEVRVSNTVRSAEWIKISYNNQNSPSSFHSVGSEQGMYVSPGTIASQVLDTGISGDRWDALFWDETVPAGTDITFEVRASDTLSGGFPDTAWIPVGGTSPVTSGLPSGQYMQWRATLTTSDPSETPVLHEVRVYHY